MKSMQALIEILCNISATLRIAGALEKSTDVMKSMQALIEILCNISATLRIAGALEKSTDVMKSMQALIKIPEIQATMRDMSKEMMKVRSSYFPKLWDCGKQCRSGSDCF